MKKRPLPTKGLLIAACALPLSFQLNAATINWDGEGAADNWSDNTNWFDATNATNDVAPISGDTVEISDGTAVDWDVSGLAYTINLTNNSGLTRNSGAVRLNGATINVASGSTLSGGFWDMNNGTLKFSNGSATAFSDWENKGTNVFRFDLGVSGFTAINGGTFRNDSNNTALTLTEKMELATYEVDMAAYTGGVGIITLLDYGTDGTTDGWNGSSWDVTSDALTDTIFQNATLDVLNFGSYVANLQWNDTENSVELNITAVPEPSTYALFTGALALGSIMTRRRR